MSKYLTFKEVPYPEGKTKRFKVVSINMGDSIGYISWYPRWRQYTFSPYPCTTWNKDCLKDITDFLQELMDERK